MPVIQSPFGFMDQPKYPSRTPGEQWDAFDHFDTDYYDKQGPFALKTPLTSEDRFVFYDEELTPFNLKTGEFSLLFYTPHFRMQWNSPWTFVEIPKGEEEPIVV